ncbi:hypothetical protein ACIQWA_33190 [Kitasatospora sp. NPDC098652]|uniref:hypothetical protein n=1 Tax=Kitasatospora sp. NPDC098652 TaxID=3364095 RepID=UPI0037FA6038
MTAILVLTAPSALAAATADPAPGDDSAVSVAVFGDDTLTEGQELTVADLTNIHAIDAALVQAYAQGAPPVEPEPPVEEPAPQPDPADGAPAVAGSAPAAVQAAGDPRYALVASWASSDHRTVNLRKGDGSGWGYDKIARKHNLNVAAIRATTRYPAPGFPVKQANPDSWNYVTKVNHVRCSGWFLWRTCKVVESRDVQVTVNYGNAKGVITAYCLGIDGRCPDWVKNAANV